MSREEDVQRLAQMILQTPPAVVYGRRTGKGLFHAGCIAEHLLQQGVILPPARKAQKEFTAEDAAAVMEGYRTARRATQESEKITVEKINEAIEILKLHQDVRRELLWPLRYYAAEVDIPEEDVIAYFYGTGVDVVDRAGRVWRNGKVLPGQEAGSHG